MFANPSAATPFGVLGPVEVRRPDGTAVAISGAKRQAVLALLLLEAGRTVSTDRLIEALYADSQGADAANALHGQVSRLRRVLRDTGAVIESSPGGYRIAVDPDAVDAHLFTRLAGEGRRILATDPATAQALLARALELWRGGDRPPLADAEFLTAHFARLVQQRLTAIEDHAEASLARGEQVTTVAELSDLLAAHPLRERACALLMRALYASGQQALALELHERTRRALAAELGADPSPELTAVHLAILREGASPGPRRVPAQLTSFVGRDEEIARLTDLLTHERLVTLTGPGGTGKTRLAIEAAAAMDGEVAFVELAPLTDARLLAQTLTAALSLNEPGLLPTAAGPPAAEAHLVTALADRRLLIILDNCEHIVDDTARLTHRLLAACPGLRILATSRESLGLTGETLFALGQLAVAPADAALPERFGCPAVRLFADRARTVRPDFRVDGDGIDDVIRICTELDGLPLAIELAAARLRSLTLAEVAAGLADRFRLLSRGSRTAAPRHQTLRAVAEWSWDLLDPAEQTLARRLSVFAGGATVASATAVCGLPALDVPDLLAGLTEKSFVDYSGGRYRMLQTIRAFCAEHLAEAGEDAAVRGAHAVHFRELTETADPHLRGSGQLEWLDRLAAENDDLRAALRWTGHTEPRLALRMGAAMSWYWYLRGLRREGAALSAELISQLGDTAPGDLAEEYALCVANAIAAPDPVVVEQPAAATRMPSDAPPRWPGTAVLCPDPDRPVAADPWAQATAHLHRGQRHVVRGEAPEAKEALDQALEGFRAVGDRWGTTNALDSLAELAAWRGDWPRTVSLMSQAVDAAEQLSSTEALTDLLCRRAKVRMLAGDLPAARADLQRATETAARTGRPGLLAELHQGFGDVVRLQGDLAEATRRYELALAAVGGEDAGLIRLKVLRGLGWIAVSTGRPEEAAEYHHTVLDAAVDRGNYLLAADAVTGLAGAALQEGDGARAALLLGAARAVHGARLTAGADVARVAQPTLELIGAAAYTAAFGRGRALSREEALGLVRKTA
ncbi:BTAD domain-containing putative transcriptional regulator [Catellatospora paridis]|uniref:BTAD domain-containing putative transcriptional regulator n=1 Tax=Catellatospora paridis TaxID=1617086 RepID=UPI0012D48449|nr:BTAD domain-containing putative transcriptional regulator [Catellatospora paridis]